MKGVPILSGQARPWRDTWLPRDNAKFGRDTKVQIREHILAALGADRAHVFDAFAGEGQMWSAIWKHAASYVGVTETWHNDERCCFVGDNHRVMRAIDLAPFTVFDFDAYGSPWDQVAILAARRPRLRAGERIGLLVTEGTWLKTRARDPVRGLREALPAKLVTPIPYTVHDAMIGRALERYVGQMGGRMVHVWRAVGTTGARVRYLGVVVDGIGEKLGASEREAEAGA